ncbi:WD repeat domain-containing protein 83 [Golovinomyces cichoracearum]|uniref:WD repeat domain-containing protein 83 n=1 Tax=Golovinomyces cichoracearum TaxID=62708 RepID=A0A420HHL4_9PEZI|nr:WD repeat domain-containing protein 83 [Golovinomyces cichoracearum]
MSFPTKPQIQLLGSNGPIHAITYSSSPSTYILTGSSDRTIRLYNPSRVDETSAQPSVRVDEKSRYKSAQLIQSYAAHGYEVLSLSIAPDNNTFASAGGDRTLFLWDVATATTTRRFSGNHGHSARINTVAFAGESASLLVSGSFDATVRIWDLKSRNVKPVMVLNEATDSVSCVIAGDGDIWASSVDGKIRRYDIRMGRMIVDLIGVPVTCLRATKDQRGLLLSGLDSQIRLMDIDTGTLLRSYRADGWKNEEFRMWSCFGGRERWVLCGNEEVKGSDGEVVVWDTLSGNLVERIKVEGSKVEGKKKIGRDGKDKERRNVISCIVWKEDGKGDQWCCGGTDGIVTVFGS